MITSQFISTASSGGRRRSLARRLALGGTLLLAVAAAAVGWHYSNVILGPDAPPARTGQHVLDLTDSTITLAATPEALRPGRWALEWDEGHGVVGKILVRDDDRVTRRFRLAAGAPPGAEARLGGFAFDADPKGWLGVDFESDTVRTSQGALPCWRIPGSEPTWAILVHGRGATRAEPLEMLAGYRRLGLPCLLITYRGDPEAPPAAGRSYRMGSTEWRDLEAAVGHAIARGARDVVLVGCSMGGGIVTQFLRLSSQRSRVRAAVLDAPALDWNAVLAQGAAQRNVATPITEFGKWVAACRSGISWDDLTQVGHAGDFTVPILIFHGEADRTVPLAVSERFATARPDLVTLVRVPGADHVQSVNLDGARYETLLTAWLAARGIGARAPAGAGAEIGRHEPDGGDTDRLR